MKKIGAYTLLTVFLLPFAIALGSAVMKNKEDIAIIRAEEHSIIRQLERIEDKLDTVQNHLINR